MGGEIVEDDIAAKARRGAVGRGAAEQHRRETLGGELEQIAFGANLRNTIRRNRIEGEVSSSTVSPAAP